ncbi:MAG: hypothetical protein ACTSXM_11385 [Promethearchaeota archaeon]
MTTVAVRAVTAEEEYKFHKREPPFCQSGRFFLSELLFFCLDISFKSILKKKHLGIFYEF